MESNIPKHIAVIMDGNGRWARRQGLPRLAGHKQGYIALKESVNAAADLGIEVFTAYAFSSENWKRSKDEVSGLMQLIQYAAKIELNEMNKKNVKIVVSGRMHELPSGLQKQLKKDIEATKNNTRIILNLAINYGGRNEIADAARKAAQMTIDGKISVDQIDDKLISSLMYHPELPEPDLLIRTAGELRLSNFLLWESAYSEIYVTQTLWPDFGEQTIIEALEDYKKRTRKFGTVVDEPVK